MEQCETALIAITHDGFRTSQKNNVFPRPKYNSLTLLGIMAPNHNKEQISQGHKYRIRANMLFKSGIVAAMDKPAGFLLIFAIARLGFPGQWTMVSVGEVGIGMR